MRVLTILTLTAKLVDTWYPWACSMAGRHRPPGHLDHHTAQNSTTMARSKSFFGLRKGSTKSLTFSTFRGQQITKDRVSYVANPQSIAQMQQRLLVPLVASARATLKTLVDHSFEGTTYGEDSLKEFSSTNLQKGSLSVLCYVPKGAMDCGLANFVISRGSLPPFTASAGDRAKLNNAVKSVHFLEFLTPADPAVAYEENSEITKEMVDLILANNPTLQRGDQITFLLCYLGNEYDYDAGKDDSRITYYHRFVISRLILDETVSQPWRVKGKTLDDGFMSIPLDHTVSPFIDLKPVYDPAVDRIVSAAAILSRKNGNNWMRSSQRLTVFGDHAEPDFQDALYSYQQSSASSSRYLNSGVDGVDITGGANK